VLTVTALDLENWAATMQAKAEFPRLLGRLVWATCSEIRQLDFRGDHHVYLRGFDGLVDCGRGNHIVSIGMSGWELTTEKNVTKKANADYEKRTLNSGGLDKAKTTFMYATPCSWPQAREWEQEKRATGPWAGVQAISSDDLEIWMDKVPWITTDFAHFCLGKNVTGLKTPEMIWKVYSNVPTSNDDPLGPDFVIGGRRAILRQVLNWMATEISVSRKRIIRISASSTREVLDFLAAGIRSAAGPEYVKLASRVVIVDNEVAALSLRGVTADHTIIGTGDVIPHMIELSRKTNCKVIIFHAHANSTATPLPGIDAIELEPIAKGEMIRGVIALGYSPEKAGALCEEYSFDYERIRRSVFLC
jgi:hypothetical protein